MSVWNKKYLSKYDDLKWDISKRYRNLSIFNTEEHTNLILDGISCMLYSTIYRNLSTEYIEGKIKKKILNRIDEFFRKITKEDP